MSPDDLTRDDPGVFTAVQMMAADMRAAYRLNPQALVHTYIPVHVAEHYGDSEIQASATRLRCVVHISDDGVTALRSFYPEGYEQI